MEEERMKLNEESKSDMNDNEISNNSASVGKSLIKNYTKKEKSNFTS